MATNDEKAKIEARIEELDRKRIERRKAKAAADAERAPLEKLALLEAIDAHGEENVVGIQTVAGMIVVKRPDTMRHRKYLAKVAQLGAKNSEASAAQMLDEAASFALAHVVYPERPAYCALAEQYPGVPSIVAGVVMDLAAGRAADVSEKS